MKILILDPKKISLKKKNTNIFLGNFFLNLIKKIRIKKDFKYSILNKNDISKKKQIRQIKISKKIYKTLLKEIIPKLNQIHSINWKYKTWDFFLGHWLHNYIAVILDRITLIKPIFKKKINFKSQIDLGKSASLVTNDLKKFTENAGKIDWNNKLISRLIYLILSKNFNNDKLLNHSKKDSIIYRDTVLSSLFFKFKIIFLKFFYSFFNRRPFIFYNSYIKNKFLLAKIIFKLGSFPFPYSFAFFDKKIIQSNINFDLRKKIKINYSDEKKLDLKIIKFLFAELFPTIYLEGFKEQRNIAIKSYLPFNIKGIFTCSAYTDNSFKFWLAEHIQMGTKIFFGSHGAGYNLRKYIYSEEHELNISHKYFTWGRKKSNSKMVSVGNFLVGSSINYNKISKINKFLLILPVYDFYKRNMGIFFSRDNINDSLQINNILNNINNIHNLHIRPHPQDYRKEISFKEFIEFKKRNIKILNSNISFQKIVNNYSFLIFTYLSTEFMNSLAQGRPCMMYINKSEFDKLKYDAQKNLLKLYSVGIIHFSGNSLVKKLNEIMINPNKWWGNSWTIKIRKEFNNNYCGSVFDDKKLLTYLKNK